MDGKVVERGNCSWWSAFQSIVPLAEFARLKPHFLVVSPPKTGSTWLSECLRRHPQVFVPSVKEIKYFSSLFHWLDVRWYLEHFRAGIDRVRGEASPSYALLPIDRIRLIRQLFPDVKLIFLMREPIDRAWSHARHVFRYRESTFAQRSEEFEQITIDQWRKSFRDPWLLASGDYLGHLRRWLEVFPREQIFVGFFEDLENRSEALLRELFTFLNVDASVSLEGFPLRERVLAGLDKTLPEELRTDLRSLHHRRSLQLAEFLKHNLGLTLPHSWSSILSLHEEVSLDPVDFDALDPAEVLAMEEDFPASHRLLHADYLGHQIIYYRRRLLALEHSVAQTDLTNEEGLRQLIERKFCFVAESVPVLREAIAQHRREQQIQQVRNLEGQVEQLLSSLQHAARAAEADRERIAALEFRLWEAGQSVQHLETQVMRMRPWYRVLGRAVMDALQGRRWGRISQPSLVEGEST